jgi:hypothetical protein
VKCSVIHFTDRNSLSSNKTNQEKLSQAACLMIQFGCLNTIGKDVTIVKFKGQWSLPYKSGSTDHSRWTASPRLQNIRSRADEVPGQRQVFACIPA